jgi:hypothetical protein
MGTLPKNTTRQSRTSWLVVMAVACSLFTGWGHADDKKPAPKPPNDAEQRFLQLQRAIEAEELRQAAQANRDAAQLRLAERLAQLAAGVVVSDDDFEDLTTEELPARLPLPARPRMGATLNSFVQIVFGGYQGDVFAAVGNQLEFLLQARLSTADLVCSLTPGQQQKLQLAGRGDIKRLLDEIHVQQKKCEQLDSGLRQDVPQDVQAIAKSLRDRLETGPFGSNSVFVKTLGRVLTNEQHVQYEKYLALERLGGRMHLRPRGDDEIKAIRMTKATLTDEGLAPLAGLAGLKSLNLDYTRVTDAGLEHIESLTNLEVLEMEGTLVRGPGLVHLRGMQSLQMLDLRRNSIDDAALVHLNGLGSLKVLQLAHTRVTGSGFASLAGLQQLETLLLVQAPVNDAGLADLASMTHLKEVNLEGTEVTDAGLPHIARVASLVTLDLRRTRVTDAGLVHLRSLKKLQAVYLFGTQVTAGGAAELERQLPDARVVR